MSNTARTVACYPIAYPFTSAVLYIVASHTYQGGRVVHPINQMSVASKSLPTPLFCE